ncbi:MAG: hypothetical protein GF364_02820 [Candidatus Lokiarchaeota archaeon]|nr:hypothetical protein [Candidatus Lokiarchaeota archaeon]
MANPNQYVLLKEFLTNIHAGLFPDEFEIISKIELITLTQDITRNINNTLKYYHGLEDLNNRIEVKSTLIFAQALLAHVCRLLRFEQQHLTKYNQILIDLKKMLLNQENIINTKCKNQAEMELKMMKDEKFMRMLDSCLDSYFFK